DLGHLLGIGRFDHHLWPDAIERVFGRPSTHVLGADDGAQISPGGLDPGDSNGRLRGHGRQLLRLFRHSPTVYAAGFSGSAPRPGRLTSECKYSTLLLRS